LRNSIKGFRVLLKIPLAPFSRGNSGLRPQIAALFVYSLIRILRENRQYELTVLSILIVCSFWSILEYLWAWKVLPKPF